MPRVACLCGSMRFYNRMLKLAEQMTIANVIILMPHCVKSADRLIEAKLDVLHKRKIDMADYIIVVTDDTWYYGDSTKSEIEYALGTGKQVLINNGTVSIGYEGE